MTTDIYESGEDYLETILIISQTKENVRAIDIAHYLNFSKPSVSRALSKLKDQGYIENRSNIITLTPEGREIAEKIYERHILFTKFLSYIGVDPTQAAKDACRMEHTMSEETFSKLKAYITTVITEE